MTNGGQLVGGQSGDAFYGALAEDDAEELYDNAPCAYLSTLTDGTIIKVNQTFLAWSGYERHSLVGHTRFRDLLAPGDRIFYETHVGPALLMQGTVREIAVELVAASGKRLPVLVNSVLKRDADGNAVAIRTALFDATERRSYERELVVAKERAQEAAAHARTLAQTLQATFLPYEIPSIPDLEIAGAYRAAGDGSVVGGDFYDVFEIRPDTWGMVLGDVCGKGAAAAVVASLARNTVRVEALRASAPSAVLTRLHEVLRRYHPDEFCTAVFVCIERVDERIRLTVACGGHPLPIRRRVDASTELVGTPGSLVGMVKETRYTDVTVVLHAGEALVLHTDGVTEARRGADFFGDTRLRALVAATPGPAQAIADAVVSAAVEFQGGDTRDDIAVVALVAGSAVAADDGGSLCDGSDVAAGRDVGNERAKGRHVLQ